jgi:hypothetical protein
VGHTLLCDRTEGDFQKGEWQMITNLGSVLSDLCVDEPIAWGKVRLHPLRLRGTANLEYLVLNDSESEGVVVIEETCTAGTVPELRVRNRAKSRVLIPEGSTLVGAKQNRVVNLSVMLAPESVTLIPVSCVERRRWRFVSPHFGCGELADAPLRSLMRAEATKSLKSMGKVHVDQEMVWHHVEGMLDKAGAGSPTRDYHALHEKRRQELADYEAQLRLPENACGVAVEINGLLEAVDLFDKLNTLHKLWPRLARSYVVTALDPECPRGSKVAVKEFLERVLSSPSESYEPVGVGTTVRLTDSEGIGAALVCEGQLVHLSVFADGTAGEHKAGTSERPVQSTQPESGSEPAKRRQPWWKFWE